MLSVLEDNRSRSDDNSQRKGVVSFDSINWDKFKNFDRKQSFLEFGNHTLESSRQLPRECLIDLQTEYYNMMLKKETELLFAITHLPIGMKLLPMKVGRGVPTTPYSLI